MTGRPQGGICFRCGRYRSDVALVRVVEQGSGFGGSLYACLDHARPLVGLPGAPAALVSAVEAMEARVGDAKARRR